MKTRTALTLGTLMLILVAAAGCHNSVADFTALSTRQIPFDIERHGEVEEQTTRHIFLIIPFGGEPDLGELVDEVLDERDADVLLDARVDFKSFYIPFIYGVDHYEIKGVAASTR